MAEIPDDRPDEDSIKPVSSLRSHFESIGSRTPTPTSPALHPSLRPEAFQQTEASRSRHSLDLPRSTTLQNNASKVGAPARPLSRQIIPSKPVGTAPGRPSSAGSDRFAAVRTVQASRNPPVVTVDSPGTTQKWSTDHQESPTRHSVSYKSQSQGFSSAPGASRNTSLQGRKLLPVEHHQEIPVNKSRGVPPPVNRADKPKLVATSNLDGLSNDRAANLQADDTVIDDRASPFSTPPSSDENPVHSQHANPDQASSQLPPKRPPRTRDSYFLPPPKRADPGSQGIRNGMEKIDSKQIRDRELSVIEAARSDQPGARPGLPMRNQVGTSNPDSANERLVDRSTKISGASAVFDSHRSRPISGFGASVPSIAKTEMLPPPRRTNRTGNLESTQGTKPNVPYNTRPSTETARAGDTVSVLATTASNSRDYPDASTVNRRPPTAKDGVRKIEIGYDTRLFDIWRDTICTSGYITRAWNVGTGEMITNLQQSEGSTRVTAIAFKPASSVDEEGQVIWLGNNYGEIQEVDLSRRGAVVAQSRAHGGREIIKIHRYQNNLWTLDEDGNLYVWAPGENGTPDLQSTPTHHRTPRGHTFSMVVQDQLWIACGRDIRVFQPKQSNDNCCLTPKPLSQAGVGEITSGAVIYGQNDRVYFGHVDGKVTLYATSNFDVLGTVTVSVYKINTLAGVGNYLWAGFNTGMIYAFDTRDQPWIVKKDWLAHRDPVAHITVDRSSLWMTGVLQVASIGTDNAIRMWEGTLEDDFLEEDMQHHDAEYCTFQELKALIVTWNAGASTPGDLRYEEKDNNFFREMLQDAASPDIVVFGFQELVDLEDKKLTAMSLFKGSKRKDPSEQDHMSRQYRAWRDHLVRCIENSMPSNQPYTLLHTASMVGLFSCIFIKSALRSRVSRTSSGEVKRGMGGLHGNKGALIYRLVLDDSSLCFIDCHLAAGQTQTMNRNNDVTAILESTVLSPQYDTLQDSEIFTSGGDGSMILDHEICILNGDLNYRIDTMGRDIVIKAVQAGNFAKLLDRDQLLVSRRRNPGLRLRAFMESPIGFAPTYKYDVGTDRYDTSEKHRAPAWCDRILYRGAGKVKQLTYRRHEMRTSDHRPVSATFKMRIKCVVPEERARVWQDAQLRLAEFRKQLTYDAKLGYLRDVLGVDIEAAKKLV